MVATPDGVEVDRIAAPKPLTRAQSRLRAAHRRAARRCGPYDPETKVFLAEAYAQAAGCLDPAVDASRALAIYYLEQAIALVDVLPSYLRSREDIAEKSSQFRDSLATLNAALK